MSPDISIIIPMYNVESFIDRCLTSIVNQTYKNWELIIVDDGSKDNSANICLRYMQKDKRIKLIKKENAGASAARNTGMDQITGKYVIFIDSDDYLDCNMLEDLYNVALKTGADVVCCNFYLEFLNKTISNRRTEQNFEYDIDNVVLSIHLFGDITPYLWNKLIKSTCIGNNRFNEEIIWGEDYIFLMEILQSGLKVIYLDKHLYHYIQRQNSICNIGYSDSIYNSILILNDYSLGIEKKYPKYKNIIISYVIVQKMVLLAWMSKNKNYNVSIMKKIKVDIRKNLFNILNEKKIKFKYVVAMIICSFSTRLYILIYYILSNHRIYY